MKSLLIAAIVTCCAAAAAADDPQGKVCPLAASPHTAPRKESHPILLIRPDQVDRYKARVADMPEKTKTFGLTTDIMLAAMIDYLRGRRCEEAVASVKKALASNDPFNVAYPVLIYDVQYLFLTPAERTTFRQQFLTAAEAVYQHSLHSKHWMYDRRALNNWTYGYGGRPLQNLLFVGLAFPEHPRSALYVAKGKQLLTWVLEGGPNNGTWNEKRGEFDVYPTKVDMIDESLSAAPVYGLGGLDNLLMVMHVLNNATDDRPFERFDRMMHSEGRWWTYNLGYKEALHYFRNNSCFASYVNSVGHGHYQPLSKFWANNPQFLYLAMCYNDPVLAWHHYANPGNIGSPDKRQFIENALWKVKSFKDQRVSWDVWTFLSWGMVAPKSAEEAGWPLTEFWPNAGSFVMRKSWARNVRVAKPGEKTGVIVGWGGPGGSKDRVFFGTVRYDADDHEILGAAPFSGTGGPTALFEHPALQNVLAVDGVAQKHVDNIRFHRLRHAVTKRLGPDTFLMDMSPQDRPDYLSVYAHLPVGGVWWNRKVHYDREKDILWIKDVASTGDKKPHKLRFNWVNSGPELIDAETIKLSGGYYLVAKSLDPGSQLKSEVNTHRDAYEQFQTAMKRNPPEMAGEPYAKEPDYYIWKSVYSGVDAPSAQIVWAIGKDPAALREYLQTEH